MMTPVEAQIALVLRLREIRAGLPKWVSEETVQVVQSTDAEALRLKAIADPGWAA